MRLLLDHHKFKNVCSKTNTLNKALFLQYGSRKTLACLVHLERVNKNPKMLHFTIARATRESHEPNAPNVIFVM